MKSILTLLILLALSACHHTPPRELETGDAAPTPAGCIGNQNADC